MEYEGRICHPPMEKSSYMLGTAVGCSYNKCRFCGLFKHLQYRLLPLEQIEAELQRIRSIGGNPKQVFLGDGNAFGMETSRLIAISEMIAHYFPNCQMINMDATVTDIQGKSDEELVQLRQLKVSRLYIGIESGLDDVLRFMKKDHNKTQAYKEIERIKSAGLSFNAHIMTGIAGHERGLENAEALAEFFNITQPERIINFSLFLSKNAPLRKYAQEGLFVPASEYENLMETRRLLELLKLPCCIFDSLHDNLEFRVRGILPEDKDKMLEKLDNAIKFHKQNDLIKI